MRKITIFSRMLAAFCMALLLSACGGENSGIDTTTSVNTLTASQPSLTFSSTTAQTFDIRLTSPEGSPVNGSYSISAPAFLDVSPKSGVLSGGTATITVKATGSGKGAISVAVTDATGESQVSVSVTSTAAGTASNGVSTITLLLSSPTLPSGKTTADTGITVTAQARNGSNAAVKSVPITFSVDDGVLSAGEVTTDDTGTASIKLGTGSNRGNRTLQVTATSGTATATVDVSVIGTHLNISGPSQVANGSQATYIVTLADSEGKGLVGEVINMSSAKGNTFASPILTTDGSGQVAVTLNASVGGADTLTASAASGAAAPVTTAVTVSPDSFKFTAPTANANINLNVATMVSVKWTHNGSAYAGQPVTFSTTRGNFVGGASSITVTTDGSGVASAQIQSAQSGSANITATGSGSLTASMPVYFVATTPASVELQASPTYIAVGSQSTLSAIVRDAAGNFVKGQQVSFSAVNDLTGGTLSASIATTDEFGRATTIYTAGSASSAAEGVVLRASLMNSGSPIQDDVNVTVGGQPTNIIIGAGNKITIVGSTIYKLPLSIIVTDNAGHPVPSTDVNITAVSTGYFKGAWVKNSTTNAWEAQDSGAGFCQTEDPENTGKINGSGVVDVNGDGALQPGVVASVTPGIVTVGEDGTGSFELTYAKNYAGWVSVKVTASTTVAGTENKKSLEFILSAAAEDVKGDTPPSGASPYGIAPTCADPF